SFDSPGYSFHKNVKTEIIPVVDKSQINYDKDGNPVSQDIQTESAQYILRKHAERIERAGGNAFKLNKSYKLLNTGVEKYNKKFKDKNMYDKGYTTILDDAYVAKNPHLKGLYELMKRRDAQYEKKHGKVTKDDLLS